MLADPAGHVPPAEHRCTHVADEVTDLADAAVVVAAFEPLPGDAIAPAAGQVGERPPPLADARRPRSGGGRPPEDRPARRRARRHRSRRPRRLRAGPARPNPSASAPTDRL